MLFRALHQLYKVLVHKVVDMTEVHLGLRQGCPGVLLLVVFVDCNTWERQVTPSWGLVNYPVFKAGQTP